MHIGLGTAAIGRPSYINLKQEVKPSAPFDLTSFKQQGRNVLEEAYAQGVRYFDTAPGYGLAEQLLMDWLADKQAADIEVATKWGYTYVANFKANAKQHEIKEHSLQKLNEQWEQSKKLLPFLTTYQIHSATLETGVLDNETILYRLAELKQRYGLKIGLTTTGVNQLEVLRKALAIEVEGTPLFEVFQVTYNILDQSIGAIFEDPRVKYLRFVIKEALANGRLLPHPDYPHYRDLYAYLQKLADKYEVGVDAVALGFCKDSIDPFIILSGAAQIAHLRSNLKASQFVLTEEEVHILQQFGLSTTRYWEERSRLMWH